MEPPLIIRGNHVESISADGLRLGVISDWESGQSTARTLLGKNDLLLLCTDGLSEARRPSVDTDFFGQSGTVSAALTPAHPTWNRSLQAMGEEVIRSAKAFAGEKLRILQQ
jgi:serine phosphatase RsbU (regulator of sigma subunit)